MESNSKANKQIAKFFEKYQPYYKNIDISILLQPTSEFNFIAYIVYTKEETRNIIDYWVHFQEYIFENKIENIEIQTPRWYDEKVFSFSEYISSQSVNTSIIQQAQDQVYIVTKGEKELLFSTF